MKRTIIIGMCILILLIGCQKVEQKCSVVIYSNDTIIFTPEECDPNYDTIYIEIPDNTIIENATLTLYMT